LQTLRALVIKGTKSIYYVISIRRRVRACIRLLVATKALATRDYVKDISRLLALSSTKSMHCIISIEGA
jgi:hypothetical protein